MVDNALSNFFTLKPIFQSILLLKTTRKHIKNLDKPICGFKKPKTPPQNLK